MRREERRERRERDGGGDRERWRDRDGVQYAV
jgi:hypothetical protein